MKKLYSLFVLCLMTAMLYASGIHFMPGIPSLRVPHRALLDTISPEGEGVRDTSTVVGRDTSIVAVPDTFRLQIPSTAQVVSASSSEMGHIFGLISEEENAEIEFLIFADELVTGEYTNVMFGAFLDGLEYYSETGVVNVVVGLDITTIEGTFVGYDGNVYIVTGAFPSMRTYLISVMPPATCDVTPGVMTLYGNEILPMVQDRATGWYSLPMTMFPGTAYLITDAEMAEDVPVKKADGEWVPMYSDISELPIAGDELTLLFDWSDTTQFAWTKCVAVAPEEPEEPAGDTILIRCSDPFYASESSATDMYVRASGDGYSVQLNFKTNDLQPGHYTDFYTGQWSYVSSNGTTDQAANITADITLEDGVTRIAVVFEGQSGNVYAISMYGTNPNGPIDIPDTPAETDVYINCTGFFTGSGSYSDYYILGTGDGYSVQLNIRTYDLQPGHYDASMFWTGSYSHVLTPNGLQVNSTTLSFDISLSGLITTIEGTITGSDRKTYHITMRGVNPASGITVDPETGAFLKEYDVLYVRLSESLFDLCCSEDREGVSSQVYFRFAGDIFGDFEQNTEAVSYILEGEDGPSFENFSAAAVLSDGASVMTVTGRGSDELDYIIRLRFTTPYPHHYTISTLPPACGAYVPEISSGERIAMTAEANGRYSAGFSSYEGACLHFTAADSEDDQANCIQRYADGLFLTDIILLGADSVLFLDYSHPTLTSDGYSIDTVFYRWTLCGDEYSHELAPLKEAGFGLTVVDAHTLDAAEADGLELPAIHLSYTTPLLYWQFEEIPDYGQLYVDSAVNKHLNRFVKDDVFASVSPMQVAYELMSEGAYYHHRNLVGIASALMNEGNLTADTVQQHVLFTPMMWHFMSLPFDVKRSDIELGEGTFAAIRRFSASDQAAGLYGNVWHNLQPNDTLHAGEGYIWQFYKMDASGEYEEEGVNTALTYGKPFASATFTALPTANKQQLFAHSEQTVALTHSEADRVWNKNWNFIANPYGCFYNFGQSGMSGVIAIYQGSEGKEGAGGYDYISLTDDYYVLRPGEAFFYQAADNETSLTFPLSGRQLSAAPDSAIFDSEGYIAPMAPQRGAGRLFYHFYLSDGTHSDRARVVINESACMDYEVGRDALKLEPLGQSNPLFYVEDQDVQMAICERPMADGVVYLSAKLPEAGTFTISLKEKTQGAVMLLDTETGVLTDLTAADYTFSEGAGVYTRRFVIGMTEVETALESIWGTEESACKIIEDGRVFIIRGGEKYDVLGNKY